MRMYVATYKQIAFNENGIDTAEGEKINTVLLNDE